MASNNQPTSCETMSTSTQVAEKAKGAVAVVGEKAERATEAVGAGMESLGRVIREHEPQTGVLHTVGEAVGVKLEGAGRYLEHHGLKGLGEDVTNLIRHHPVPALLVGIGIGFLLARTVRS